MINNDFSVKVLGSVSPYCKGEKNCPGFLINYGNNKILLDCGNGITGLLNFPEDLKNLHIFISHLHRDHYVDLFSIADAAHVYNNLDLLKEKVKLYIPKVYEPEEWERDYPKEYYDYMLLKRLNKYFNFINYNQSNKFSIEGLNISFIENTHGIPCYSTKLEDDESKLIYTADTGYQVAKNLIKFAENSNLLIAESTFVRSDNKFNENHLHAHQSAEIARYAKVKKLLLTHFWPEHNPLDYLNEAKPIFENTEIAEEGKILKLRKS